MRSMGRGTSQRLVEGKNPALRHDQTRYGIEVAQYIPKRDPKRTDSLIRHPDVTFSITLRLIAAIMRLAIDLDRELGRWAIEIERV